MFSRWVFYIETAVGKRNLWKLSEEFVNYIKKWKKGLVRMKICRYFGLFCTFVSEVGRRGGGISI